MWYQAALEDCAGLDRGQDESRDAGKLTGYGRMGNVLFGTIT